MDDERSVVVLGAVVGATLGGLAGYLFLTDGGAAVRRDLVARMNALVLDGFAPIQFTRDTSWVIAQTRQALGLT